ncbi:MAG: two-component system, LuxR family, response regulator FixJ [Sphingomonadales bacterium]|jgi:two-component system response regulator FixJ|nr:two-component system, LuxR family, response regulator FixJ [Sphingomonadales bacterium]MEA3044703.1 two-component system, LuxR family, response regulator FixJ [Sphingomonadales bacterium]
MSASRTIAIIDDDDAVRHSTAGLLRRAGHRVEAYTDGAEFLASDLPEDLACILLDMRMPGVDGLAVMRALVQRGVSSPILVLTGHGDIPMAVEAMRLGAVDFLEKPYPAQDLLQAIGRVLMAGPGTKGGTADPEAVAKIARLSQRQQQVLKGILKGQPNKIIAYELGLSIRTVEAYRAQLMEKLGVRGTAEAVRMALAAGLDGPLLTAGPNIE